VVRWRTWVHESDIPIPQKKSRLRYQLGDGHLTTRNRPLPRPILSTHSLIVARGVNTRWHFFAQTTSLHPARRALLDLYLVAAVHPNFPQPHGRTATACPRIRPRGEPCRPDVTWGCSRRCVLPVGVLVAVQGGSLLGVAGACGTGRGPEGES
jgi:hypothetical protein